ncbi:double zinc ribbon domain-containing protein [Orbus sturtevantii]|uniref:DNA utilization protein GntX n=1 Tax=Orbus sturtevantii TaxID=3074109 RepID=UPI00370D55E7
MNCILCRLPLTLHWGICSQCFRHLPYFVSVCYRCGLPLFIKDTPCYHCLSLKPNWHRLIAVADYQKPFTKLIYQFKFNQKTELSYPLARLIFLAWYNARLSTGLIKPDIVTCVPLHHNRYWSRGYNQSALLAKHIAYWLGADFRPYLLQRKNNQADQKSLSKLQRRQNVEHIFYCKASLMEKTIAVIDDIVTTGYTINEVSKQLMLQGALNIQVLCLCRTTL